METWEAEGPEVLLEHLHLRSRGRIVLVDGDVQIAVYVDDGRILAAEASDDADLLLRRACVEGLVPAEQVRSLEQQIADTRSIGPLLDALPVEQLDAPLRDRFVDNVARFASSDRGARFEAMNATIVENLQMVFNAEGLVADCTAMGEAARAMDQEQEIERGPRLPADERQQRVVALVTRGPRRVRDVVERLPEEPFAALALIAELLDLRVVIPPVLRYDQEPTQQLEPIESRAGTLPSTPFADVLGLPRASRTASVPADWAMRPRRTNSLDEDEAEPTPVPPPPPPDPSPRRVAPAPKPATEPPPAAEPASEGQRVLVLGVVLLLAIIGAIAVLLVG